MFNENSQVVKSWVSLVKNEGSTYTRESVPNLFNLREVVYSILDSGSTPEAVTENV